MDLEFRKLTEFPVFKTAVLVKYVEVFNLDNLSVCRVLSLRLRGQDLSFLLYDCQI